MLRPAESLEQILLHQTFVVQQLGLYLARPEYVPTAKELNLLEDIAERASDAVEVCRFLEKDFFRRMRQAG